MRLLSLSSLLVMFFILANISSLYSSAYNRNRFEAEKSSNLGRMPVVVLIDVDEAQRGFYRSFRKGFINFTMAPIMSKQKQTGEHTLDGTASFATRPGVGFLVGWDYTPLSYLNFFSEYSLDRFSYYPPDELPDFNLVQNQKMASRWCVGARFFMGPYFFFGAHFGSREDYSFMVETTTLGSANKAWHHFAGVKLGYHILHYSVFTLDGSIGADYLFPKSTPVFDFGKGVSVNTEIRFKFDFILPIFSFFRFEYFKLEPEFLRKHNGYYYLFGVGTLITADPRR